VAKALDENIRGRLVALAQRKVDDQLRVALDGDEAIGIAVVRIVVFIDLLLLFLDERPNFVGFDVPSPERSRLDAP
jgi:hypothetical protein